MRSAPPRGATIRTRLVVRTRHHRCRRCRGICRRVREQARRDRVADHCAAVKGWDGRSINLHDSRRSVRTAYVKCSDPAAVMGNPMYETQHMRSMHRARPHRICAARYQPGLLNFCLGHQIVRCMQQHDTEIKQQDEGRRSRGGSRTVRHEGDSNWGAAGCGSSLTPTNG